MCSNTHAWLELVGEANEYIVCHKPFHKTILLHHRLLYNIVHIHRTYYITQYGSTVYIGMVMVVLHYSHT